MLGEPAKKEEKKCVPMAPHHPESGDNPYPDRLTSPGTCKDETKSDDKGLHDWKSAPYVDPTSLGGPPIDLAKTERCPVLASGRKTLVDGVTIAVPYPEKGFNC